MTDPAERDPIEEKFYRKCPEFAEPDLDSLIKALGNDMIGDKIRNWRTRALEAFRAVESIPPERNSELEKAFESGHQSPEELDKIFEWFLNALKAVDFGPDGLTDPPDFSDDLQREEIREIARLSGVLPPDRLSSDQRSLVELELVFNWLIGKCYILLHTLENQKNGEKEDEVELLVALAFDVARFPEFGSVYTRLLTMKRQFEILNDESHKWDADYPGILRVGSGPARELTPQEREQNAVDLRRLLKAEIKVIPDQVPFDPDQDFPPDLLAFVTERRIVPSRLTPGEARLHDILQLIGATDLFLRNGYESLKASLHQKVLAGIHRSFPTAQVEVPSWLLDGSPGYLGIQMMKRIDAIFVNQMPLFTTGRFSTLEQEISQYPSCALHLENLRFYRQQAIFYIAAYLCIPPDTLGQLKQLVETKTKHGLTQKEQDEVDRMLPQMFTAMLRAGLAEMPFFAGLSAPTIGNDTNCLLPPSRLTLEQSNAQKMFCLSAVAQSIARAYYEAYQKESKVEHN